MSNKLQHALAKDEPTFIHYVKMKACITLIIKKFHKGCVSALFKDKVYEYMAQCSRQDKNHWKPGRSITEKNMNEMFGNARAFYNTDGFNSTLIVFPGWLSRIAASARLQSCSLLTRNQAPDPSHRCGTGEYRLPRRGLHQSFIIRRHIGFL